jgi:RNA polymerase sigma-70 factor (ECF subfamily)
VVLTAAGGDAAAREALEQLAQRYWPPLYAYLRRQGCAAPEAEDLTQGFFARLLEGDGLGRLEPRTGSFRAFLLTSLKNYLHNEREREGALKRGGGRRILSISPAAADRELAAEPFHESTPELAFERSWAQAVLQRALERLERCYRDDETGRFALLKERMLDPNGRSYVELCELLGASETAVKVAMHRLRRRFATCLREEVADTVSTPDAVEEELQDLLAALRAR